MENKGKEVLGTKVDVVKTTPEDGWVPYEKGTEYIVHKGYTFDVKASTDDPRITRIAIIIFCLLLIIIGVVCILYGSLLILGVLFIIISLVILVREMIVINKIEKKYKNDINYDNSFGGVVNANKEFWKNIFSKFRK